jgi:hypothetical protein
LEGVDFLSQKKVLDPTARQISDGLGERSRARVEIFPFSLKKEKLLFFWIRETLR